MGAGAVDIYTLIGSAVMDDHGATEPDCYGNGTWTVREIVICTLYIGQTV